MLALLVAVSQTIVRIAAPGEDTALREHAAIHLLPADAIVLHDRLVGNAEGSAGLVAPISGIKSYRGLMEAFTGAAESKEALRVQVGEDKDQDVEGQVRDTADFVRHCGIV